MMRFACLTLSIITVLLGQKGLDRPQEVRHIRGRSTPDLIEIDNIVSVDEHIAHAGDVRPRHERMIAAKAGGKDA